MNVPGASRLISSNASQGSSAFTGPSITAADFARIVDCAGRPVALAAKRGQTTSLRCECHHAKSIHARMYANPKLGTSCNYPGCRCKAYKAGSTAKTKKSK
jgi:hypothetical protein